MGDAIEAKVDMREWSRALKEYASEVTNHDLPFILNRRGRNIASKASHYTPRATLEEIDAAMADRSLFRLVNWQRAKKGLRPLGGPAMSEPARTELKRRHSSRGYIAAGWTPAIIKFGGRSRAHLAKSELINRAQNKLASAGDLTAILENTAHDAGKVGFDALQKAIELDTADMSKYVQKLQSTARKHSAK